MWNMRWILIGLFAALITVTSAQALTTDDVFVVQVPENVTFAAEHNGTLVDDSVSPDNKLSINSSINNVTDNARQSMGRGLIIDIFPENNENHGDSAIDTRSISSRETTETNEEIQPIEPPLSREETKEISPSEENNSDNESQSQENLSPEKPSSSENSTPDKPNSENDTNEKPNSKEPESNEKSESGEALSIEDSNTNEKPDGVSPVSTSKETEEPASTVEEPCSTGEEQVVQTTHGPVKGRQWQETPEIIGFIDIPYGKIKGPFEAPLTAQSWLDIHYATEHTKLCPQLHNDEYIGYTDCLTLSIFAPKDAENASVLFHIYDGYSSIKSADPLIYGPDYLVPKGIILVLPNYRVGPLGFLCMQNETAPGNAALKDLSLALEWIKDNIQHFGGNPSNIVVSGDGAAGAYAGCLALCSRSKYYINKAITESGSALSHWALDRDPIRTAYKLADKIRSELSDEGIVYNNTFEEVALKTIIKVAKGMRFNPCIEHDKEPFMNDTPWKILQDEEIDTTFMIGSASFAGTHEAIDTTTDFVTEINKDFGQILPADLVFKNDDERKEYAQKLKEQYFGEDNITMNDMEELSLWYTDASYLGPGIRLARPLLAAGATVYLYEFAFVGDLNRELEAMNKPVPGAVRSDIVGYLFRKNGTLVEDDSPERRMIDLMVDLWVSFINTGKPVAENVEWNELKKVEDTEEEWLLINSQTKPKKGIHVDWMRLWTRIYDEHFIEHNSALGRSLRSYLAVAVALMCWMASN